MVRRRLFLLNALRACIVSCIWTNFASFNANAAPVQFNRDIRPILSDRCFLCHGPEQQQADLRLDLRESAVEWAIVPGDAANSEIISRISSNNDETAMPPRGSHKPRLTADEINVVRRWIDEGAVYEPHWAFKLPIRASSPAVDNQTWPRNAIDRFVLAELEAKGITPQEQADRRTIIRRVTLDLTGLPPARAEIAAYLSDESPDAYEKVVDRLLASKAYGEHQSRYWLDATRYADTNGYQYDLQREQWVWRDWVIHAFNTNKPFDQFTIEQLAGDLLPEATDQTRLATGMLRNHPITIEGGVIDEEYRTEYVMDRVATTGTVWLGLTIGCARCHDHKYDPISQREFYSMFAYFNNVPERGLNGFDPKEKITSPLREGSDSQPSVQDEYPHTMIVTEMDSPRQTYVLDRGEYDKPLKNQQVFPSVPKAFGILPDGAPANRLGLAKWIVADNNPLTARVIVNRFWAQLFGRGLVTTIEDFGSQGAYPSHPELLDWLAVDFVESGWDVKQLLRTIVTSSTYRQASRISESLLARDPNNRELARGPRFRLDAESIRDSALGVSGLLDRRIGGPSVFPYHPKGLWLEINNRPGLSAPYPHTTDKSQLYRRSMYTFWKRTVAPPSLATFDAPEREYCVVSRSRTNTPLQAFVLLNDPQFVEAARALAEGMIREGGDGLTQQLAFGFEVCTSREATTKELAVLKRTYEERLNRYRDDPSAAESLISIGESSRDKSIDSAELAAMTTVARLLLNLSEFITKS